MTEQERFEQEAAKHFMAENLAGSAFLKDRFGEYMHPQINWGWHCWQAAQQKEGYVLVPVELTYKQALSVARSDFDAGANIFNHEHRHLSNDDKAEIKGRWIGSKAFTIQDQYMALIKAAQEAE